LQVAARALTPLFAPCTESWSGFNFRALPYEHALWAILDQRPLHFLPAEYARWEDLLLAAADDVIAGATKEFGSLAGATWGKRNTVRLRHPFSRALPAWLGSFIDLPAQPLPGDSNTPRAQSRSDGASQRLVVAPGRESEGLFHMPGGQSGHPLSPYYRAGHGAWAAGEPTPLLPGPAVHTLELAP
jgi:penicillin amidase